VTADDQVVVRCDAVGRTFGEGRRAVVAVHDVTCVVQAGERIAVTGPSGSGKSTLLHLVAGLDLPTNGTLSWPALGGREHLRPGPVGVVFQNPSLLAPLDVAENVALPRLLAGADEDEARAGAHRALARLGLADLADRLPEELSGGQAQRVAAARVLAGRPRLILADEPTGQLDHATGTAVVEALLEAATVTGAALLLTTHDPLVASLLPTRWAMSDGTLHSERGTASCSA
jgi:ABC-type lipoprotein export system ATPase subunit